MNYTDKPRADSRLKTLTDERQAEIATFAAVHTLAGTVSWLKVSGTQTNTNSLSKFLRWHRLNQQQTRSEAAILKVVAELAKKDPALAAERLYEVGHLLFAGSALEHQDPRAWCHLQQLALRKSNSELNHAKYERELARASNDSVQLISSYGGVLSPAEL
jgi:hypothetical protein